MNPCTLLLPLLVLSACSASLPQPSTEMDVVDAAPLIAGRAVKFCDVKKGERRCPSLSRGLSANGLGGVFLPLAAQIEAIDFGSEYAEISLKVNEFPALCSDGRLDWDQVQGGVRIEGLFCNWLAIGNVASTVTLSFDWVESADRFGGRYAIGFGGTGNGSGSGYFVAQSN